MVSLRGIIPFGAALLSGFLGISGVWAQDPPAAGTPTELRNIKDLPRQSLPPDPPSVRGERVRRMPVDPLTNTIPSDPRNRLARDAGAVPYSPRASSSATPPTRRSIENFQFWNRYSTWYDGEYTPYYYRQNSRYYYQDAPVADRHPVPSMSGSYAEPIRSTSPGNRNRYYYYETDRRWNPVPLNGAGHNYNMNY
jgi:hypothetical protein